MGQNLDRSGGVEERKVEREESPTQIGRDAQDHAAAGLTHNRRVRPPDSGSVITVTTDIVAAKFTAYGPSHLTVLAVFAVGVCVLIMVGRAQRGTASVDRFCKVFAVAIACITVPLQILQFLPGEWRLQTSLPLQLCDLAWIIAVYALWTRRLLPVTITYLWGITLTSQGLLTPDLNSVFPDPRFLMFFGMHLLIIWASFYLVLGLGITPTWATYRRTLEVTLLWAVLTYIFNVIVDTNYGYLNAKPKKASLLDFLGPWPLYVVLEIAIVAVVWALLVWSIRRARPAT